MMTTLPGPPLVIETPRLRLVRLTDTTPGSQHVQWFHENWSDPVATGWRYAIFCFLVWSSVLPFFAPSPPISQHLAPKPSHQAALNAADTAPTSPTPATPASAHGPSPCCSR